MNLLEADLEDLDESVRVVESAGDRWGLGDEEIRKRRSFVERVKNDVHGLRRKVMSRDGKGKGKGKERDRAPYRDLPDAERGMNPEDEDEQRRWEMEEQQVSLWYRTYGCQADEIDIDEAPR